MGVGYKLQHEFRVCEYYFVTQCDVQNEKDVSVVL